MRANVLLRRKSTVEMQILSFNFLMYTMIGLWRPIEWSSKCSKSLYSVCTFFTIYLLTFTVLTNLLYIAFIVDNVNAFVSCISLALSVISTWFKAILTVIHRDRIMNLTEILQKEPYKACNEEETDIQMKFDRSIRSYSMYYVIICTFSGMGGLIGGIFYILDGQIPFGSVWVPWDYTSYLLFYLTSFQEIVGVTLIATVVNVATETTILGFCLQICAQFEILKHRLRRIIERNEGEDTPKSSLNSTSNKTSKLSEHISFHLCIIRLAEMINDVFSQVIFIQFFISILVLCTAVYHLSTHSTFADIATFTVYIICMFIQIFIYCWAGNEVTLKSAGLGDEIYQMDWILMTSSEQKDLLMIMKRGTRPIKLTSSFLVTLSLESYGNLLKASFSTFNVLQQF